MLKRIIVVLGVAGLVVAAAGGWWSYSRGQAAEARTLRASGMLEANEVKLSSEVGGRLATRPVREDERVRQGSVLAIFDTGYGRPAAAFWLPSVGGCRGC